MAANKVAHSVPANHKITKLVNKSTWEYAFDNVRSATHVPWNRHFLFTLKGSHDYSPCYIFLLEIRVNPGSCAALKHARVHQPWADCSTHDVFLIKLPFQPETFHESNSTVFGGAVVAYLASTCNSSHRSDRDYMPFIQTNEQMSGSLSKLDKYATDDWNNTESSNTTDHTRLDSELVVSLSPARGEFSLCL